MELISIVVPVYKVEDFLERCVKSIQNQTYQKLEIILVDDGSPDRSGTICDELAEKDKRIKVIHKSNGGLSDARNVGVKEATGKYLLFVDSDDYISPNLVEKTVAVAEKNSCDIVLFDYYYVENGKCEVRTNNVPDNQIINLEKEQKLLLIPPAVWIKLYNRQFYNKVNCSFPKGLYYEDLGTTPKMLTEAKRIVYLKEPLYYYIIRGNSIMNSNNYERNQHDIVVILEQILSYYKEKGLFNQYRQELEYLAFLNIYFEPSKEMVLAHADKKYLKKSRESMNQIFPEFKKNKYVKSLRKKDKLHLWILNYGQYWLMRLLSNARKIVDNIRGR